MPRPQKLIRSGVAPFFVGGRFARQCGESAQYPPRRAHLVEEQGLADREDAGTTATPGNAEIVPPRSAVADLSRLDPRGLHISSSGIICMSVRKRRSKGFSYSRRSLRSDCGEQAAHKSIALVRSGRAKVSFLDVSLVSRGFCSFVASCCVGATYPLNEPRKRVILFSHSPFAAPAYLQKTIGKA